MSFAGLRVLSLESRRAKDMENMILRQEGVPLVTPSVKERAVDDHSIAFEFVERLEAGEFEMVVLMTGTGLAFLRDVVAPRIPPERLGEALRKAVVVSRGTKPVPVLRTLQAKADILIPEPNTWREVVEAVRLRSERRIAIQEYGRPNFEMNAALEALGAIVTPFAIYRWEFPDDMEPLRRAARELAGRTIDVVIFTSSIQLDHLFEVARGLGVENEVLDSLQHHAVVASVGPVMTAALEACGIAPDIVPEQAKLGALVKVTADAGMAAIRAKRF